MTGCDITLTSATGPISLVFVAKQSDSPQRRVGDLTSSREARKEFTLGLLCALCASAVDFALSQQELA
jgi:hypothetical protein